MFNKLSAARTTGPCLAPSMQGIQDSTNSEGPSLRCSPGPKTKRTEASGPYEDPSHSRQYPLPSCSCDAGADCVLSSLRCGPAPKRWMMRERGCGCVSRFAIWHRALNMPPPLRAWAPTRLVSCRGTHLDHNRSRRKATILLALPKGSVAGRELKEHWMKKRGWCLD